MSVAPFKPEYLAACALMRQMQELGAQRVAGQLSIPEFLGKHMQNYAAFEKACADAESARTCRQCRCTARRPCATPDGPCGWVLEDLCSACAVKVAA